MRRRSPLVGLIVPLALLAGQLSTIVHSLLVEHERCREHGELVHRALVRGHDAAPETRALGAMAQLGPAENRRPHASSEATSERHAHEHCLSLLNRRDGLRPPEQPAGASFALPVAALAADTTPATLGSAGLFRLAPKTSPPRPTLTV